MSAAVKANAYWRRQVLLELEDGAAMVRRGGGWVREGGPIFGRVFSVRTLRDLAKSGLVNPDFERTGRATRQRELPLVPAGQGGSACP